MNGICYLSGSINATWLVKFRKGHSIYVQEDDRQRRISSGLRDRIELAMSERCPKCRSTGECPKCDGTGTNVALNSDQEKCPHCDGTGICQTCGGGAEITTLGLSE